MSVRFTSIHNPSPVGRWFYEVGGERVEGPTWYAIQHRVEDMMARHGVTGNPEEVVAAYMCPQMPEWFCRSDEPDNPDVVRRQEALDKAVPYFNRPVVPPMEIERRIEICRRCPKHQGSICLTCTGILDWINRGFGGRRVSVDMDKVSRTCSVARTFESVVATVDFGSEPPPDGTPPNCWRNEK